ncbi:hypothetical protein V3C99_011305 [Haemonchus contortus]
MQKVAIFVVLVGVAKGINCPPLALVDGTVFYVPPSVEGGYAAGTIAQGMCNIGFHMEGAAATNCKDGIWQPVLGVCKSNTQESTTLVPTLPTLPAQCPPIIVAGGTAIYDLSDRNSTDEWLKADGSKVSITCERGFELDGASQSTCVKGVWEPPIGFCKLKICTNSSPVLRDCPSMPSPAGASLTYSNNSASAMTFPTGTLVVMNCTAGSAQGPAAASCSNGTWIPPTLGTCSSMVMNVTEKCPALAIPSGMVDYSDPDILKLQKDHETKVYLTCLPNTMPEGPISSYCHNGTWTPELGACYVHCL